MTNLKSKTEVKKAEGNGVSAVVMERFSKMDIPDIGVGRMTTTTTRILMELMLEDSEYDRLSVLESVIEYLKIEPEDFSRMRHNRAKHEKLDYDNDVRYSWQ